MSEADVEKEIAELNSRRAALELARERRAEQADVARRLEEAKQAVFDEEALAKAEQEHGVRRIAVVRTELGAVIVKRPHANTFRKFLDSGKTDTDTLEKLVRPCLVHPQLEGFEKIVAELPAVLGQVALAIGRLAGIRAEDIGGKS